MRISLRMILLSVLIVSFTKIDAQEPNMEKIKQGDSLQSGEEKVITVNLYYTGKNGSARKFVEEMESSGTVTAIRNESGNLRYEYFISISDPETVLLIDSWSSQEAIDIHHTSPMMKTIATLREKYDLHMKVERYIKDEGFRVKDDEFIRH
ncbi:MAG: putative quinol monooxygenase [Phocaeicola sp.]|uniref:putative quinol monooxygenase n=1 Tax=Phocaeicola sp. TaxID=2773926 RepID=UPI003F9F7F18